MAEKQRFEISLEDLQTFLAVADLSSFSRAAERLNLSQPSVSNRVRRLEEKLDVRLLHRTRRKVELTRDGARMQARASEALASLRELLQEFHAEAGVRRSQLDVSATLMVTTIALPPLVRSFSRAYPNIVMRLTDRSPSAALDDVASGRSDLAIMVAEALPNALRAELLLDDRCVVVTPLNHPLLARPTATLADVLGHPLLSADVHVPLRRAIEKAAAARGLTVNIFEPARGVSNVMTLLAMAAAGLGVIIHPRSLIAPELRPTIGVVELSDCEIIRSFSIITGRDRELSPAARLFRDHLRSAVARGEFGSAE